MAADDIVLNVVVNGEERVKELSNTVRNLIATQKGLTRASRAMDARQRSLSEAIGVTNKGLGEHAKSIRQVVTNQKVLSSEIQRLQKDARLLAGSVRNLNKEFQRKDARAYAGYLNNVAKSMRAVKARALVSDLKSLSLQIKKSGKDAQFVGRSLIIGLTTPLMLFARRGIDAFRNLNKETVRLEKIASKTFQETLTPQKINALGDSFEKLGMDIGDATNVIGAIDNAMYNLSQRTGISRDLLIGVTADFAELGIQAGDVLAGLTKLTAEMSILGSMDMSEAQGLAQVMFLGTIRTLDLMGREFESTAAKQEAAMKSINAQLVLFNAIENNTALSFRDMADSIPEASAAATSFGLSMTQTAALLAPMKAAGIDISTAANGLKVSLQRLVTPTVKTRKEMANLVKTFEDVAPALESNFASIQGVGTASIQGLIDTTMTLRDVATDEQILSFYANLFQKRQAPRMLIVIDSLVQFQKELLGTAGPASASVNAMTDALNGFIKSANASNRAMLNQIDNVEDFSSIARIASAESGEFIQSLGRAVFDEDIAAAREVRRQLREYVKDVKQDQGIDIIDEISSQAGKGLFVELLGAADAQQLANEELQTALNATYTAIDRLRNSLKNIAAELVKAFEKDIKAVSDAFVSFSERVRNMSEGTKRFIAIVLGLVASIGPLVFVFGQVKLAIGVLSGALLRLLPSMVALDAHSLAAAPGLLRLRRAVILSGDGFTTASGRFSRFIATLASGRGPIAGIANQFGIMTGILKKDITAGADVLGRVDMPTAAGERVATAIESATIKLTNAQNTATQANASAITTSGNQVATAITTAGTQAAMAIQSAVGLGVVSTTATPIGQAVPRSLGRFQVGTNITPGRSVPLNTPTIAQNLTTRELENIAIEYLQAHGYTPPLTRTGMLSMARGAVSTRAGSPDIGYDEAIERARRLSVRSASLGLSFKTIGNLDRVSSDFVTGRVRGGVATASREGLLSGSRSLVDRAAQLKQSAEARRVAAEAASAANAAQTAARLSQFQTPTYQSVLGMPASARGGMGAQDFLASQMTRKARFGRAMGRAGVIAGGAAGGVGGVAQRGVALAQEAAGFGMRGVAKAFRGGAKLFEPRPISEAKAYRGMSQEVIEKQRDLRTMLLRERGFTFDDDGRATTKGGFSGRRKQGAGRFVQNAAIRRQLLIHRGGRLGRLAAADPADAARMFSRSGIADAGRGLATKASDFGKSRQGIKSLTTAIEGAKKKQEDLTLKSILYNKKAPSAFRRAGVNARFAAKGMAGFTGRTLLGNQAVDNMVAKMQLLKTQALGSFGLMKGGIVSALKSMMSLTNAMRLARTALFGAAALTALLAIAGVVAVVVGNFEEIKTKVQPAMDALMATLETLKEIGLALIDPFMDFFALIGGGGSSASSIDGIANAFNGVAGFIQNAATKVQSFVEQYVVPFMRKALGAINTIYEGFKNIVKGAIGVKNGTQGAFDQLKSGVSKVFDGIKQLFLGTLAPALISGAAALIKGMYRVFIKLAEFMPQIIVGIVRLFVEFRILALKLIKFLVVGAARLFAQLPGFLGNVFERMIHLVTEFVRNALDSLWLIGDVIGLVATPFLAGIDVLSSGVKELGEGATWALNGMVDGLDAGLDALLKVADVATDFVGDAAMDLAGKLSDVIGDALDGTEEQFDSFIDKYKDEALNFLEQFKPNEVSNDLGEELKDGISEALAEDTEEIYEPIIDASSDAGEEAGESFADKFKDKMQDIRQKFVDLVGDFLSNEIQDVTNELVDALEKQKEAALAVFDEQLNAIDALERAEESLIKQKEFNANKQEILDKRELDRQNFIRNRALAIYEGRIDDARLLSLEDQKNASDSARSIEELERKRQEDLRKENLEFLKNQIKETKKAAEEFFKSQIEAFKESAKEITKFAPQTIEDYENQLTQLKEKATQFANDNAIEFAKTFDQMQTQIVEGMPNKVVGVFSEDLNDLIEVAREKYGLDSTDKGIVGATVSLLTQMGDTFSPDGEYATTINTNWSSIVDGLGAELTAVGTGTITDVIKNHGPQQVLADAIAFANESILREWRGTVGHIISEVDGLADMMDPFIAAVAQAQIQFEMLEGAARGAGNAITGAAAAGAGMPSGVVGSTPISGILPAGQLSMEEIDSFRNIASRYVERSLPNIGDVRASQYTTAITNAIAAFEALAMTNRPDRYQSIYDMQKASLTGAILNGFKSYIATAYPSITRRYGGSVPGFSNQAVPALLHGGEYVINAKAASMIGLTALNRMNDMRFRMPDNNKGGYNVTTINKTETVNIYVDNFIGQEEWFNSMVKQYDMKVQPMKDKKFNREERFYRTYKGASY